VRDEIHVQSVNPIPILANPCFEQVLGLFSGQARADETQTARNAMNVRVDRHGRQPKRKEQDARRGLWSDTGQRFEPPAAI
jgi:hypothetical protein